MIEILFTELPTLIKLPCRREREQQFDLPWQLHRERSKCSEKGNSNLVSMLNSVYSNSYIKLYKTVKIPRFKVVLCKRGRLFIVKPSK